MAFILLRLQGPMQAWGTRSRFEYRDTEREPTFSGIIGMIAAAEGLPRGADLGEYHQLRMTVRVDREGELSREFQTAEGVITAKGTVSKDAQIVRRDFLADAAFHAVLEGPETLIKRIFAALRRPRYPLFLGRKSYVPSVPVIYPGDESYIDHHRNALSFLTQLPVTDHPPLHLDDLTAEGESMNVRFVIPGTNPDDDMRRDIPLNFDIHHRRYAARYIKTEYRNVPLARNKGGHDDS